MKSTRVGKKVEEEAVIAPVTILDAAGRVVRIVPAKEFQLAAAAAREAATTRTTDDAGRPDDARRPGGRIVRPFRCHNNHGQEDDTCAGA